MICKYFFQTFYKVIAHWSYLLKSLEKKNPVSLLFLFILHQGTACTYFKRFYLNNSTMDYHPKYIMWVSQWLLSIWPISSGIHTKYQSYNFFTDNQLKDFCNSVRLVETFSRSEVFISKLTSNWWSLWQVTINSKSSRLNPPLSSLCTYSRVASFCDTEQGIENFFAVWEHKLRCKNFLRDLMFKNGATLVIWYRGRFLWKLFLS